MTTVCVVGSGGREHALAHCLALGAEVVVTPGNPGMPASSGERHRITVTDAAPEEIEADLFVIGPEAPLVGGLADRLRAKGRRVFGPCAAGARLEGSKAFMKQVLAAANVPTARFEIFDSVAPALSFLRSLPPPWVVKTDGLAAGKGVLVTTTIEEAEADVEAKLSGAAFGEAGRRIVIEQGLTGTECSVQVLCDGKHVAPLAPARDFKRLEDADRGPNTGGMGAYSPSLEADDDVVDAVLDRAIEPLVGELQRRGIDYRGVLYAGVMLTDEGPMVLEFNVRFGDPEAQVVLPRLADDPVDILAAVAEGNLRDAPRFVADAAVCVVQAAAGYPGVVRHGDEISGLGADGQLADAVPGVTVFHAGTARSAAGRFVTAGGRVLGLTAVAPTLVEARRRAYLATSRVSWPGCRYRTDIAGPAEAGVGAGGPEATAAAAERR